GAGGVIRVPAHRPMPPPAASAAAPHPPPSTHPAGIGSRDPRGARDGDGKCKLYLPLDGKQQAVCEGQTNR
ncbi:unnamed protein product, partial [Tetraodon nigroviridis]